MCTAHGITPKRGDIRRMGHVLRAAEAGLYGAEGAAARRCGSELGDSGVDLGLRDCGCGGGRNFLGVYPTQGEVSMHKYLLAGWGCPIGMWISITVRFPTFIRCEYLVQGFIFYGFGRPDGAVSIDPALAEIIR